MKRNSRPGVSGFTLVELLVVIGIIALLISILMPALRKARLAAIEVTCASNQRQIMIAFLMFAGEHHGELPGNFVDFDQPDVDHRSWLVNSGDAIGTAPQQGTIYKYLKDINVYRDPAQDFYATGDRSSSNGQFDYCAMGVLTGAKLSKLKPEVRFTYADGRVILVPTPVIVEEELFAINWGGLVEGLHNNVDRFSNVHRGGSNYASIDGSVHWLSEPPGTSCYSFVGKGPSGADVTFGNFGFGIRYGWWNKK